jgi:hypothetical protein
MWSAAFDKARQLLELRFTEGVDPAQAEACAAWVERLLTEAAPGFCLLTDFTGLEQMEIRCLPVIDRLMDVLNRHGISKVVRVVPDPAKDIGFGIMSLFHYGHTVRVVTCDSLPTAEVHLPK